MKVQDERYTDFLYQVGSKDSDILFVTERRVKVIVKEVKKGSGDMLVEIIRIKIVVREVPLNPKKDSAKSF